MENRLLAILQDCYIAKSSIPLCENSVSEREMTLTKSILKKSMFKARLYRVSSLRNRFYIIPYHMIVNEPNGFYPQRSSRDFEQQVSYLSRNYNVISLDEVVERVKKGYSLRRCVAITFDDGFEDNYLNAYPVLKKHNVPATIFLTTGCVENGRAPWFIRLRYVFMKTTKTHLDFHVNGTTFSSSMKTEEQRFLASDKVMNYFKNCPGDEILSLLEKLCNELGVREFQELNGMMLKWDQIKEMSRNGISFGAHTVNHPILTQIPLDNVKKEIQNSKEAIEGRLEKPVSSFAYPFGKKGQYGPQILPILVRLGFKYAVTTEARPNTHTVNLFELNRSVPWEFSLL